MITVIIPTTPERRANALDCARLVMARSGIPCRVTIFENTLGGWVPAVLAAIEDIDGYVALIGTDVEVEQDWLRILSDAFFKGFPNGDGIAEPFNELHGPTLCQHPLAHAKTIRKYLHRGYLHNFSDNEMTIRALRDHKLIFVPAARIKHHHWTNRRAPMDQTYQVAMASHEQDKLLFQRRLAAGFPSDELSEGLRRI